jgi:hypothetical protein
MMVRLLCLKCSQINLRYSQVGGVACHELNALELEFLFSVNFSLHVTAEEFSKYHSELLRHLSGLNPAPAMTIAASSGCVAAQFGGPSSTAAAEAIGDIAGAAGGSHLVSQAPEPDVVLQGRGQGGGRLLTDHQSYTTGGAPVYAAPAAYAGAQGYAGGHHK